MGWLEEYVRLCSDEEYAPELISIVISESIQCRLAEMRSIGVGGTITEEGTCYFVVGEAEADRIRLFCENRVPLPYKIPRCATAQLAGNTDYVVALALCPSISESDEGTYDSTSGHICLLPDGVATTAVLGSSASQDHIYNKIIVSKKLLELAPLELRLKKSLNCGIYSSLSSCYWLFETLYCQVNSLSQTAVVEKIPFFRRWADISTFANTSPKMARAFQVLADSLRESSQFKEAAETYKYILTIINPEKDPARSDITTNNLSICYYKLGLLANAEQLLSQLLKSSSVAQDVRIDALNNLGSVLYLLGDYGKAADLFEESLAVQDSETTRRNLNLANSATLREYRKCEMRIAVVAGCLVLVGSQWLKIATKKRRLRIPDCELRLREANRAQKQSKHQRAVSLFVERVITRSLACIQSEDRARVALQRRSPLRQSATLSAIVAACNVVTAGYRFLHILHCGIAAVLGIACTVTEPGELLLSQHLNYPNESLGRTVHAKHIASALHAAMRGGEYPILINAIRQVRDEQEWVDVQNYWAVDPAYRPTRSARVRQSVGGTQGNSLLHQQLSLMKLEDVCSSMMTENGIWYHVTSKTINRYSLMRKRPWMPSSRNPLPVAIPKTIRGKRFSVRLQSAGSYPDLQSTRKVLLDDESDFLKSLYKNAPIEEPATEHVLSAKLARQRAAAVLAEQRHWCSHSPALIQSEFLKSNSKQLKLLNTTDNSPLLDSRKLVNTSSLQKPNYSKSSRNRNRISIKKPNYFTADNFGESMVATSASFSTTCHRVRCDLCQGDLLQREYQRRSAMFSLEEQERDVIGNCLLSSLVLVMWNIGGLPATRSVRNFLIPALVANEQQRRVALQALRTEQLTVIQKQFVTQTSHMTMQPPIAVQLALRII